MTRVLPLSLSSLSFSFVRTPLIRLCIVILLLLVTRYPLLATNPAPASVIASAPVKNLRLPGFNDSGHRTSLIRAGEARYISQTHIDVLDLNFSQFAGDGSTQPVNLLLAPSATVTITGKDSYLLSGKQSVRLIAPKAEATGEDWTYQHHDKTDTGRLVMNKNVRVVFHTELKGLLD
jgi:hypothetical protein